MDAAGGVELEGGGVIDAPVVKLIIKITSSYHVAAGLHYKRRYGGHSVCNVP